MWNNYLETIEDLKYEIQAAVTTIKPEIIEKILQNWLGLISYCKLSRDGHLFEIVSTNKFHKTTFQINVRPLKNIEPFFFSLTF